MVGSIGNSGTVRYPSSPVVLKKEKVSNEDANQKIDELVVVTPNETELDPEPG